MRTNRAVLKHTGHTDSVWPLWTIAAVLVATLAMGIGFVLFPAIGDDLGYMTPFRDFLIGGRPFDVSVVRSSIINRAYCDNARLANVVMILLAPMPRIVPTLLSAVAFGAVLALGIRIGRFQTSLPAVSLYIAGIVFCCPWIDQLYIVDFLINYLWATALMLWLFWLWLQGKSQVGLFLLAVVTGAWHEGFGVPAMAAILAAACLRPDSRRTVSAVLALLGLAIGLAYLYFSPAMFSRALPSAGYFTGRMIMVVPFALPAVAYIVIFIVRLVRRKAIDPADILMITVAVVSVSMMLRLEMGSRVGMPGIVCSLIGMSGLVRQSRRSAVVAAVCGAITLVHLIAVDIQCYRLGRETADVVAAYRRNPDAVITSPMTSRADAPAICLFKPYYDWFAHRSTVERFTYMYGSADHPLRVIPEAVAAYESKRAAAIPGNAGLSAWHGYIVGPLRRSWLGSDDFIADYGRGMRRRSYYMVPFESSADGKSYAWYSPDNTWLDATLHPQPLRIDTVPPATPEL